MTRSLNELSTEARYWRGIIEPLVAAHKLLWDVLVDFPKGTVTARIVHPTHSGQTGKFPELVARVDLDRKKRSEKIILDEINNVIANKVAIG